MESQEDLADLCNTLAMAASPLRLKALRFLDTAAGPADLPAIAAACGVETAGSFRMQLDLLQHAELIQAATKGNTGPTLYRLAEGGRRLVAAAARLEGRLA